MKFKKSELKTGMRVEMRDGIMHCVMTNTEAESIFSGVN